MCQHKQVLIFTTNPPHSAKVMATDALPTHYPVALPSQHTDSINGFICLIPDPNHKNYMTGVTIGGRCVRIYEL